MAGIWAKIGEMFRRGTGAAKGVLFLVPKALVYPTKKPFASLGEMKRDATVSLGGAAGAGAPEKGKKCDPRVETTEAGKNLGIEISYRDGKVRFLASKTLTGSIPCLTPEQLSRMKEINLNKENRCLSIGVLREKNRVVVEVNAEDVINKVRGVSRNKEKGPEEIEKLVLEGIYDEIDRNLKDLAGVTGGEFKVHTGRKLLRGIVGKLHRECNEQLSKASSEDSSNTRGPSEHTGKITTEGNMTNPLLAYYQEVADGKASGVRFHSKGQQDILGKLGSSLSNPGGARNKPKEPLFTPAVGENIKREKGGRS